MSLLFNFRPLVINPQLAERIGLNEAIVLQQLKYWLNETESGVEHDGRRWVYNTVEQWQKQFPFWSPDTVKRALKSLQSQGLVSAEQLAKAKHDHTNHYSINYRSGALIDQGNLPQSEEGNLPQSNGSDCPDLLTEITTKTTTENSSSNLTDPMEGFDQFYKLYPKKVGHKAARTAWLKLSPGADLRATLMTSLGKQCVSEEWIKEKARYAPNPATWLNGERWTDVLPAAIKSASNYRDLPDHTDAMYSGVANGKPAF
ncbi:hypothetical protein QN366_01475 [Pseudomonas sp. CCC3.2]|uniref:hypothetical protein n=1 Tax=unclassified Pseudomonas TaxID=196821 RepID=UPI002AB4F787|nr:MULTISPECIES: hypothetical protein [unclassified Pseudomonas]MDY7560191.1 hypothetical protein [Pseudomonas sp. AB6]MEB0178740.1 hypothetical protein [Pseudomonas sp. CCC3.2]MEB0211378.1 hypothetical protein [Pseudomonas sp. AB6]